MTGDPLGQAYLEALSLARGRGEGPVSIQVTRPPFPGLGEGGLRVVAVRPCGAGCRWILAYPSYRRLARRDAGRG